MCLDKNWLLYSTKNLRRNLLKVIAHNATIWVECRAIHLPLGYNQRNPNLPPLGTLGNQCCQGQPMEQKENRK